MQKPVRKKGSIMVRVGNHKAYLVQQLLIHLSSFRRGGGTRQIKNTGYSKIPSGEFKTDFWEG